MKSELEKEIEKLIEEKKRLQKKIKNKDPFLNVDDVIAEKQKIAYLARRKRDNFKPTNPLLAKYGIKNTSKIANTKELTNKATTKENVTVKEEVNLKAIKITKGELISNLRLAKMSHKRQMDFIHVLIKTNNFHEVKATYPTKFTACNFGKWFYGEGLVLSFVEKYQTIEKPHQLIHEIYLNIYSLYKDEIKSSLFKSKNKQIAEREQLILKEWSKLKKQSQLFFEAILALENVIVNLSDQEMDKINKF